MATDRKCPTCRGKNQVMISCCTGQVIEDELGFCPDCKENMGLEECPDCQGIGKVPGSKKGFSDKRYGLNSQAEYFNASRKDS